jgi:hypothetical protein
VLLPSQRERLNAALQCGQDISSTLLNYRKDGSTFWNSIHLANVSTMLPTGELAPYLIIGLHAEVSPTHVLTCILSASTLTIHLTIDTYRR